MTAATVLVLAATAFLTTVASWAAVIAAIAGAVAGILAFTNRKTVQEIKVNVNHRLDDALDEIASLREALGIAKASPAEKRKEPRNDVHK